PITPTTAGVRTKAIRHRRICPHCACSGRAPGTGAAGRCPPRSEGWPIHCSRPPRSYAPRQEASSLAATVHHGGVSSEELENYETDAELALYREYRDVVNLFSYVVETERRFYLANHVDLQVRSAGGEVFFELTLTDAWVWDIYRSARFVRSVRVVTFKDVNVEELSKPDLELPD